MDFFRRIVHKRSLTEFLKYFFFVFKQKLIQCDRPSETEDCTSLLTCCLAPRQQEIGVTVLLFFSCDGFWSSEAFPLLRVTMSGMEYFKLFFGLIQVLIDNPLASKQIYKFIIISA